MRVHAAIAKSLLTEIFVIDSAPRPKVVGIACVFFDVTQYNPKNRPWDSSFLTIRFWVRHRAPQMVTSLRCTLYRSPRHRHNNASMASRSYLLVETQGVFLILRPPGLKKAIPRCQGNRFFVAREGVLVLQEKGFSCKRRRFPYLGQSIGQEATHPVARVDDHFEALQRPVTL